MKREMINVSLQRYGTRMLEAGDTFEANRRDARVLNALKKAKFAAATGDPVDAVHAEHGANDQIAALRDQYEAKFGKRPFNGWKADELKAKIAAGPAEG